MADVALWAIADRMADAGPAASGAAMSGGAPVRLDSISVGAVAAAGQTVTEGKIGEADRAAIDRSVEQACADRAFDLAKVRQHGARPLGIAGRRAFRVDDHVADLAGRLQILGGNIPALP